MGSSVYVTYSRVTVYSTLHQTLIRATTYVIIIHVLYPSQYLYFPLGKILEVWWS